MQLEKVRYEVKAHAAGGFSLPSRLLVLLFARGAELPKVEAFLAAVPLVTLATFLANRVWTFSARD